MSERAKYLSIAIADRLMGTSPVWILDRLDTWFKTLAPTDNCLDLDDMWTLDFVQDGARLVHVVDCEFCRKILAAIMEVSETEIDNLQESGQRLEALDEYFELSKSIARIEEGISHEEEKGDER